jgi:hypothetical protein
MRILFIAPSYHPHIGGVEYVVKSVAERSTKAGHRVSITRVKFYIEIKELNKVCGIVL